MMRDDEMGERWVLPKTVAGEGRKVGREGEGSKREKRVGLRKLQSLVGQNYPSFFVN